jgi:hypothetical protein
VIANQTVTAKTMTLGQRALYFIFFAASELDRRTLTLKSSLSLNLKNWIAQTNKSRRFQEDKNKLVV